VRRPSAALTATPGEFSGRLWSSAGHALRSTQREITLDPDVTARRGDGQPGPARPFAIKDSFAGLDLAPHGLTPLFDSHMDRRIGPGGGGTTELGRGHQPGDLVRWEAAWAGGGEVIGLFQPRLLG
jgi:hypothetical protein